MNNSMYILIIMDILLIGLVLRFAIQWRSGEKRQAEKEMRLKELNDNITKLIIQADIVAQNLTRSAEEKEKSLLQLLGKIDDKEKDWLKLLKTWKPVETSPNTGKEYLNSDKSQRYKLVNELAGKGLSPGEIARQVDLPFGEIELLMNLTR